jgi:hypothetical protein
MGHIKRFKVVSGPYLMENIARAQRNMQGVSERGLQ